MTNTNTTIDTGDTSTLSPRARARQVKRDRGVCYDCSNPTIPGQARCDKCATRARERQKTYDYARSSKRRKDTMTPNESKGRVAMKEAITSMANLMNATDRDFYEEGCEAYISGKGGTPPADVSEFGVDAEAEWLSGYEDSQYMAQDEDYDGEC